MIQKEAKTPSTTNEPSTKPSGSIPTQTPTFTSTKLISNNIPDESYINRLTRVFFFKMDNYNF